MAALRYRHHGCLRVFCADDGKNDLFAVTIADQIVSNSDCLIGKLNPIMETADYFLQSCRLPCSLNLTSGLNWPLQSSGRFCFKPRQRLEKWLSLRSPTLSGFGFEAALVW
jgi:hypothetical protein